MITDSTGREVLGGGDGFPVDVRSLARELRRLWEGAEAEATAGGKTIARACSRNLVAVARDADEAKALTAAVAEASDRHPVRAFVVEAAADDSERIEAWLTAHCRMRGEGRHVCCEQIRLVVGGDAGRRAAGAVIPLLVPDLPVFLWCAGTPPWENEFFRRLLDVSDRLIVDSRTFPDPAAGLEDLVERRGEEWSPADLNWYRHESWREAVAVCFDDPRLARRAGEVDRIGVGYGTASAAAPGAGATSAGAAHGAIPAAAALLAGWALDRVELAREAGPTGLAARVEAGDAAGEATPPEVVLERMTDAPSGEIARTHLSVSSESISFRIECPGEGEVLTLDANTPHAGSHRHRLPRVRLPLERLLARALDDASPDVVYERALLRAASILSGTSPD